MTTTNASKMNGNGTMNRIHTYLQEQEQNLADPESGFSRALEMCSTPSAPAELPQFSEAFRLLCEEGPSPNALARFEEASGRLMTLFYGLNGLSYSYDTQNENMADLQRRVKALEDKPDKPVAQEDERSLLAEVMRKLCREQCTKLLSAAAEYKAATDQFDSASAADRVASWELLAGAREGWLKAAAATQVQVLMLEACNVTLPMIEWTDISDRRLLEIPDLPSSPMACAPMVSRHQALCMAVAALDALTDCDKKKTARTMCEVYCHLWDNRLTEGLTIEQFSIGFDMASQGAYAQTHECTPRDGGNTEYRYTITKRGKDVAVDLAQEVRDKYYAEILETAPKKK